MAGLTRMSVLSVRLEIGCWDVARRRRGRRRIVSTMLVLVFCAYADLCHVGRRGVVVREYRLRDSGVLLCGGVQSRTPVSTATIW